MKDGCKKLYVPDDGHTRSKHCLAHNMTLQYNISNCMVSCLPRYPVQLVTYIQYCVPVWLIFNLCMYKDNINHEKVKNQQNRDTVLYIHK
jgi:hypothetical protein